jgi:PRC-barrel domain protein
MKKTTLVAAAILTTVSSLALAQSASPNSGSAPSAATTTSPQSGGSSLRQQLTNSLQQSGFTNIKVVADSFLVQANDKSGNPVTMFIGPHSATEVTTVGSNDQASDSAATNAGAHTGGMFTSLPAKDELSSKVVGLDVYNNANQNIGTIKDVAYNGTSVNGYIIGVGGFLGMGDHYVAVRPSAVKLSYDAKDKKWHASMDANADQLKAAPEYKYPSNT